MKIITDYFDEEIEYPQYVALNPIPINTLWWYISYTFLNGFINYVTPLKVFVLDRYSKPKTKEMLQYNGKVHTDFSCFGDDIIILAKVESEYDLSRNVFMFFWFDMDVSDCAIGRFETTDKPYQVFDALKNWLEAKKNDNHAKFFMEDHDNGVLNYHELPTSFCNGWMSFM